MKKKAAARAAPGRAAGRARGGKARASTAAPAPPAATTIAAPANDAFFLKLDASCTLRETADALEIELEKLFDRVKG